MTTSPTRPSEYELIRELRQSRVFSEQPIDEPVVQDLLEIARWSGSAKNTQPWDFLVLRDRERIAAIAELGQFSGFLKNAPLVIVLVFNGTSTRSESYDEGRVSERLMLAAKAYGLGSGTGWWGTPEGAADKVKALLGIPADKAVISAVAIGHPMGNQPLGPNPGRKPLSEIFHYETFGNRSS
ncbi:MAG: nitroreductase family protein [Thermomicrobiales bacterium]